jgi:hypothetical protein
MAVAAERKTNHDGTGLKFRSVEEWAAIQGVWKFSQQDSSGEFLGRESTLAPNERSKIGDSVGLSIAAGRLRDGVIRTEVTLDGDDHRSSKQTPNSWLEGQTAGIVFGYDNPDQRYYVAHLGGFGRGYGIMVFEPGRGWVSLIHTGSAENLRHGTVYRLRFELRGQSVSLTVNDVEVIPDFALPDSPDGQSFGLYAYGNVKTTFRETKFAVRQPRVFVVMPFSEPYDTFYRAVIRKVAKQEQFDLVRVDEIRGPGNILEDIRRQIATAHVVVAEISSPNTNVFYEVGYAHALNKPVILLARRNEDQPLPFDLRPYRVIFYDDTIGGKAEVERTLREHLRAVLR